MAAAVSREECETKIRVTVPTTACVCEHFGKRKRTLIQDGMIIASEACGQRIKDTEQRTGHFYTVNMCELAIIPEAYLLCKAANRTILKVKGMKGRQWAPLFANGDGRTGPVQHLSATPRTVTGPSERVETLFRTGMTAQKKLGPRFAKVLMQCSYDFL